MTRTARGFAVALAFVGGTPAVVAQEAPARTSQIYQHRTADGRIVLSDRPVAGAQLQRTWNIANEDTVAARERSEKGRLEAQAVSERIQRQLDADRQRAEAQEAAREIRRGADEYAEHVREGAEREARDTREEATADASQTIEEGLRRRAQIDDEVKELEARRVRLSPDGQAPVASSSQGTLT